MGDRGNIAIEQPGASDTLFLYTHWGGSELTGSLASALFRGKRWEDPSYLSRIVLNELQGDDRGDTGFGICVGRPDDNEYDIPVLRWVEVGTPNRPRQKLRIDYRDRRYTPDEFIVVFLPSTDELGTPL